MNRIDIRDKFGKIIGFIDEQSNGDKTVRDQYGKIIGYYKKGPDYTTDEYGRIIAQGEVCSMLIKR